jgi:hypothetical protein
VDIAVTVAAAGLLGALAVAGLSRSRQADRFTFCTAKLEAIGAGNGQFALANQDRMFGLTWEKGGANSQYPDLNSLQAGSQAGAHAAQVIDTLRRRGRPDIPVIANWIPDISFASVALVEFQNRPLSDPFNLCPSDDLLNKWRRWPAAFDQGRFLPRQPDPTPLNKRWPYSSSYALTAGAFDINQSINVASTSGPTVQARLYQGGNAHNLYSIPVTSNLGPSAMSIVALPSQKVHVFEEFQRHLPGVDLYFMYPQSTRPILFFDGSVRVKTSQDAHGSWNPNFPSSPSPTTVIYSPRLWEPPLANGQPFPATEVVSDPYRWTRDGLLGWDFQN